MGKPVSILIVDDDLGMLKTLKYILTYKGYEVVALNTGVEAIEQIKERSFDIVLIDLRMPDMNGVEVLKEIKRLDPETNVMMITAYTMHELVEKAKKGGAKAILSKPLDLDEIISYAEEFRTNRREPVQNDDLSELLQILDDKEKEMRGKETLIEEMKKELAEIKKNPYQMLEEERKKRQSENIQTVLKTKQLELFNILCQEEKNYEEILKTSQSENIGIRDMAALRLQMSRLDKKLAKETNFKVEKIRRNKILYFRIHQVTAKES